MEKSPWIVLFQLWDLFFCSILLLEVGIQTCEQIGLRFEISWRQIFLQMRSAAF